MKLIKCLAVICVGVIVTLRAQAALDLVAEVGLPAVDFPPDFIYWNVTGPVIGRGGHIAFTGAADTSISSTANNTNAVWAGLPGQLHAVIKESESPAGFPGNVLFSAVTPGNIFISRSGNVALAAVLTGVASGGILVEIDNSVSGILKTGDQAPGFPPGTLVGTLKIESFSDAGMIISGSLSPTFEGVLWFWDAQTQSFEVITSTNGDQVSSLYPGCKAPVAALPLAVSPVNSSGEIALLTGLTKVAPDDVCPATVLLTWKDGLFSKVVESGDAPPGMPANTIFPIGFSSVPPAPQINDAGEVTFFAGIRDQAGAKTYGSVWMARPNGNLDLVALQGESLPGNPSALIGPLSFFGNPTLSNASSKTASLALLPVLGQTVLIGPPKQSFSLSNFSNIGVSHLSLLASQTDQPAGFDATWFYDTIFPPSINEQGAVLFTAVVKDAQDVNFSATTGIWKGNGAADLERVAFEGMAINVDGSNGTLTKVGEGQFSDRGQVIFAGARSSSALGPTFAGSIFITQLPVKQDLVIDFGAIGLWARMNDATWQKLNNSSPDQVVTGDIDGNGTDDIIADFSSTFGGIFVKRNQGGWSQLHNSTPDMMAVGDLDNNGKDDIVIDFGAIGLWARMNDTSWTKLNNASPTQLVVGDMDGNGEDDVIAVFNSGIFVKRNLGGWSQLHNFIPDSMAVGDLDGNGKDDVVIDFGGIALWARMNDTAWTKLHNTSPDLIATGDIDGNGADDVLATYGSSFGGLWQKVNLGGWSQLNANAPDEVITADVDGSGQADIVADFSSTLGGIFVKRNQGIWSKLHNFNPDSLAAGNLDKN